MIFHQLFESETSTYTYILADEETREAIIVDPVLETADRDLKLLGELNLKLKYIVDTHIHADHVTGAGHLRKMTGAQTGVSAQAKVDCADISLRDGDELSFGKYKLKALETPGHTDSCMSYFVDGKVFTGDALLIRGTGRTDFQQGSSDKLYDSIKTKLFSLPDETIVYPGHDYRGFASSTIGLEKKYNPRVGAGRTKDEFVKIMGELKLANPKKIHEAVPANLGCGIKENRSIINAQKVDGIPVVNPEAVRPALGKVRIIDVRTTEEFNNELGHIGGAELVVLGEDLVRFLESENPEQEIVFVCRSGGRSGHATKYAMDLGYKKVMNMSGGMIRWNELGFPVERR